MGIKAQCPFCKKMFRKTDTHWYGCPKDPAYKPDIFE